MPKLTKRDKTPGRAAHNLDLTHPVITDPSKMTAALCGGGMWHKGAYVTEKTVFGFGFAELVLNPDGTYFLNDTSG